MNENATTDANECSEQPITDRTEDRSGLASNARPSADASTDCVACGDSIDVEEWHPVETERNSDDNLTIHAFCDQDCYDRWSDSRSP